MKWSFYLLGSTSAVLLALGAIESGGAAQGVIVALPFVLASFLLCRYADPRGEMNLMGLFALAVSLRWIVAAGVHYLLYVKQPGLFAPDEIFYDESGRYFAEFLNGRVPDPWPGQFAGGITWIIGGSYALFGWVPLVPKLLNGVVGGWSAVLTALIAEQVFSTVVARRAGFIAAVAPSLVLWSALNTKDASTLLGVQLSLLAFLLLRKHARVETLLLFVAGLLFTAANRTYEVMFIGAGVSVGFLFGERKRMVRNAVLAAALLSALVMVAARTGATNSFSGDQGASTLEYVAMLRSGYSSGAGSAIGTEIFDTSTVTGLATWAPIGLFYFFLAPFPFTGTSSTAIATSPEMLVWYFLLPSVIRGARIALKKRLSQVVPLLAYLLSSSIGWSLVVTNVGTLYRYRAQVLFVPIVFIAADQVRRSWEARVAAERALPAPLPKDRTVPFPSTVKPLRWTSDV